MFLVLLRTRAGEVQRKYYTLGGMKWISSYIRVLSNLYHGKFYGARHFRAVSLIVAACSAMSVSLPTERPGDLVPSLFVSVWPTCVVVVEGPKMYCPTTKPLFPPARPSPRSSQTFFGTRKRRGYVYNLQGVQIPLYIRTPQKYKVECQCLDQWQSAQNNGSAGEEKFPQSILKSLNLTSGSAEVLRSDGQAYPPKSIYQLLCGIYLQQFCYRL